MKHRQTNGTVSARRHLHRSRPLDFTSKPPVAESRILTCLSILVDLNHRI
jgi:hypothetical protein